MATRRPYQRHPAPRMAGLPLLVALVLVAAVIGGTAFAYTYWTPTLHTSARIEESPPLLRDSYRQPIYDAAFAIVVRNEVLGGPHAVPEQAT